MQILGFNFTKISAEKAEHFDRPNMSTNVEFTDLQKEKVEFLKNSEAVKLSFKYDLSYEKTKEKESEIHGSIKCEGKIILSLSKEESKNLFKSWKKRQIPPDMKIPLFNIVLRRCTPKAVYLQDEINLPSHIPMPRLTSKQE